MKALEERKQSLQHRLKKRSRSSKTTPPPSASTKRVVQVEAYEEPGMLKVSKPGETTPTSHTRQHSNEKLNEMERRVKQELLEAGLSSSSQRTPERLGEQQWSGQQWSGHASPLTSEPMTGRGSGQEKWVEPSLHGSTYPHQHRSSSSPTTNMSQSVPAKSRVMPHHDSSDWTEFACASVSGSSVEVGGGGGGADCGQASHFNSEGSAANVSEFDPIPTHPSSLDSSRSPHS